MMRTLLKVEIFWGSMVERGLWEEDTVPAVVDNSGSPCVCQVQYVIQSISLAHIAGDRQG
jgi:hypothetical protein